MRFRLTFLIGFAGGYFFGTRAGRQRYEQIVAALRNLRENPTVQSAAAVLQQQATDLVENAKQHATGH